MSMGKKDILSICANCGKEGDDVNNICNKCKVVKYCNATCKKKHRHKHKKDCEEYVRLAAECAAELHDIELFKQPPPLEDCPICFQQLPSMDSGSTFNSCCGKVICTACIHSPVFDNQGNKVNNKKCPFCRIPYPTSLEEDFQRMKKRVDAGDPEAMYNSGCDYRDGLHGFPQDYTKALELFHRAAELSHSKAYNSIGYAYNNGEGVEIDRKKAVNYYKLAAMGGSAAARFNLGNDEWRAGNFDRALRHYMIAVRGGHAESLEMFKQLYSAGHATKDDYTKALQSYQAYLGEIKSDQRDKAAAAHEEYRYY